MNRKNYMKKEVIESIKYVIPIIFIFIGIIVLNRYTEIEEFFYNNTKIITNILMPLLIGFIIAYILN